MNQGKITNEPVYIQEDGKTVPYIPGHITTARDGYAASLHLLFKHVADFHITMVDLLAEKYKFKAEEAMDALHADPRFHDMIVNPTIHSMSYFKEEEYNVATNMVSQHTVVPLESTHTPMVPLIEAPKKKKTVVRKKKVETIEESVDAITQEQKEKLEELFGPESNEGDVTGETNVISENTIPEISTLSAKELALQKAKARAMAGRKKKADVE